MRAARTSRILQQIERQAVAGDLCSHPSDHFGASTEYVPRRLASHRAVFPRESCQNSSVSYASPPYSASRWLISPHLEGVRAKCPPKPIQQITLVVHHAASRHAHVNTRAWIVHPHSLRSALAKSIAQSRQHRSESCKERTPYRTLRGATGWPWCSSTPGGEVLARRHLSRQWSFRAHPVHGEPRAHCESEPSILDVSLRGRKALASQFHTRLMRTRAASGGTPSTELTKILTTRASAVWLTANN